MTHPITPSPKLVEQWYKEWLNCDYIGLESYIATKAARWGADTELEACRLWVSEVHSIYDAAELLNQRRPKPPSLKEQALEQLECVNGILRNQGIIKTDIIRRALEALPDD